MFQIGKTIVSEEIIQKDFMCNLSACKGACCIDGEAGAPLTKDETEILKSIYPKVKPFLRKESIAAIEEQGVFVTNEYGDWERGNATSLLLNSSGNNVYGTNLAGEYAPDTKSFLISPCYDLSQTSNPVLKFDMAYDLEENWDVFYVEYSTDGSNWNVLGTSNDSNWYNSDRTLASSGGTDCNNCPGAQWTGTNSTLQEYSHELSSISNLTNITFRFVFHSDPAVEQEGVIIDNLIVEGTTLSSENFDKTDIAIYPNPSKNIFNLKSKTLFNFDFNVTDITGKIVLQKRNVAIQRNLYQIDMTAFTSGIYFLNIRSNGGTLSKKLVLN